MVLTCSLCSLCSWCDTAGNLIERSPGQHIETSRCCWLWLH